MMRIDPWSATTYQDYAKLREEFGIEEFSDDILKILPNPIKILRRGIVFGHRDFHRIRDAILKKEPWAILTGLMPSGRMHLGHKMVIDEVIYYQSIGADVSIAVADIEAYATRNYSFKETKRFAFEEYLPNYIALGLKPEKCRIYFQSKNTDVKDLAYILGRKVNWSEMLAIYGFNSSTNMSHVLSPLIQVGDILHVQLEKYGGIRPTLVPVGVDQDPHIRLTRDIADAFRIYSITKTSDNKIGVFVKVDKDIKKLLDVAQTLLENLGYKKLKRIDSYKAIYIDDAQEGDIEKIDFKFAKKEREFNENSFIAPSSTYHRFMTGLTGEKMSSSKPETAIFLTDKAEDVRRKIRNAKTGGAATLEEQKKHGGKPNQCMVYELFLYHLVEDDRELEKIYFSCTQGERMCGDCKKYAIELMEKFLKELAEKREQAKEEIKHYISNG
ncbi:MAG: tryptophan--tRNA ligase [Thermoplasmata archaeon]|nr:tryptophan--tRNA ligase [Thermoplasmata archaeon]